MEDLLTIGWGRKKGWLVNLDEYTIDWLIIDVLSVINFES